MSKKTPPPTSNFLTRVFSRPSSSSSKTKPKSKKPSTKTSFLKPWKNNSQLAAYTSKNSTTISFLTININSTDIFGISILFKEISALLDIHFTFLSKQPDFIRWFIILWEMTVVSICILHLGRLLDILWITTKLIDDGARSFVDLLFGIIVATYNFFTYIF
ncbi:2716_t:CDS:1 [Funneliformis mosseae]|uniref:2716_t:CDS:1 n=1 Tax=Funneliformis mosseae TaxID=27381 RepID=A0A9N9FNF3_FUNMO|nr:2716_t:CDS:1 [Funneliformis mosseae]